MQINYQYVKGLDLQEILEQLQRGNAVVRIKGFPKSDNVLQSFIEQIGKPISEMRNIDGLGVFDVKIDKQNDFFTSIASSNLEFPLHTDCADFEIVPNCIGLLCVNPAPLEQGTSRFMFLKEFLKNLSDKEVQYLCSKNWKFRNQSRPILNNNFEEITICYDRITMESFSKLDNSEFKLLTRLDGLFKSSSFALKLEKGDLVLFRNDLMLHGRTRFDKDSGRLVKRIRFNIR